MINTPLVLQMCDTNPELRPWAPSVSEAIETGPIFSQGFELTSSEFCNAMGQAYQGSVVLVIDAGCYSTTDMFAAGFQDHKIGKILGIGGHTGAGGANVWVHGDLERALPTEFIAIPKGASFRVAIRRSTRVRERSGAPLEDLGVIPDELYRMTRNDLLNHNADLIAHACGMLTQMPNQRLAATCSRRVDGTVDVELITRNVGRIDIWLNARPVHSVNSADGSTSLNLTLPPQPAPPPARRESLGVSRIP